MTRRCGDCQLCCRLLPTEEINKPHGERCPHQKHGVGCAIYARRPMSCSLWNCRWLVDESTRDLQRPDRAHYVIDLIPDFVTMRPDDGATPVHIEVIQIWVDPAHKLVHRNAAFRAWLDAQGKPAIIRYSPRDGFVLFPPSVAGRWIEHDSQPEGREHTLEEKAAALGGVLEIDLAQDPSEMAHYKTTLRVGDQAIPIAAGHADLELAKVALTNARKISDERKALIEQGGKS